MIFSCFGFITNSELYEAESFHKGKNRVFNESKVTFV